MRERWMLILVVGLSVLALAGSGLFAFSRAVAPEDADGRDEARAAGGISGPAVFRTRCRRCHSVAEAVALVQEKPVDEREGFLTELLERHFPPPPEERSALIGYLIAESAAR